MEYQLQQANSNTTFVNVKLNPHFPYNQSPFNSNTTFVNVKQ